MCVLCGELIMNVHWTEENRQENGMTDQRNRRRTRLARAKFVNQILMYYGLSLSEWNGTRYLLCDKKGATTIIQDLGGLWPAAQKLHGRPLDPLDPSLLAFMKGADSHDR